jgi:hypothetical protein
VFPTSEVLAHRNRANWFVHEGVTRLLLKSVEVVLIGRANQANCFRSRRKVGRLHKIQKVESYCSAA